MIDLKTPWLKFIPLVGIVFCLIDKSHDGDFWERGYIYYHVVVSAILTMFI